MSSEKVPLPSTSSDRKENQAASPKNVPARGPIGSRDVSQGVQGIPREQPDVVFVEVELKLPETDHYKYMTILSTSEKRQVEALLTEESVEALEKQGCELCPAIEGAHSVSKYIKIKQEKQDQGSSKPLLFLLVAGIYRASSPGSGELTARLRKNNVSYFKRTIALYRQLIGTIVSFVRPLPGMSMSELSFRFPEGAKEQLERAARIDFFGEGDRKSHSFVSLMSAEECRLWASEQQSMPRYSDQAEMGLHSDSVFVAISTVTKDAIIVNRIESLCEAKETEKAFAKTLEMYSRYKHPPIMLRFAYPITELPYSEFTQWSPEEQEGLRFAWIEDVLERCCVPLERRELSVFLTDCNGAQRWASCENEIVNPLCPSAKCNRDLAIICTTIKTSFDENIVELVWAILGFAPMGRVAASFDGMPRSLGALRRIVDHAYICGLAADTAASPQKEEGTGEKCGDAATLSSSSTEMQSKDKSDAEKESSDSRRVQEVITEKAEEPAKGQRSVSLAEPLVTTPSSSSFPVTSSFSVLPARTAPSRRDYVEPYRWLPPDFSGWEGAEETEEDHRGRMVSLLGTRPLIQPENSLAAQRLDELRKAYVMGHHVSPPRYQMGILRQRTEEKDSITVALPPQSVKRMGWDARYGRGLGSLPSHTKSRQFSDGDERSDSISLDVSPERGLGSHGSSSVGRTYIVKSKRAPQAYQPYDGMNATPRSSRDDEMRFGWQPDDRTSDSSIGLR